MTNPSSATMTCEWPGDALTPPAVDNTYGRGAVMAQATCSSDCTRPVYARGLCNAHYLRWRRGQDVTTPIGAHRRHPHFKTDAATGCWVWQRCMGTNGYGYTQHPLFGRSMPAHRVYWELVYGVLLPGVQIDHLCRNRACCNPAHLEPVTAWENWSRGYSPTAVNARKTHCIHGHEYTPENTLYQGVGQRLCRQCKRDRSQRYRREGKPS